MNAIINGKNVTFEAGENILAVAKRNGFFIPSLCAFMPLDHKPGVCRVCRVECTPPSGSTCIVPACVTPLEEGMRVETATAAVRARQRMQVELLLFEHRLSCESCSRLGSCELQSLREALGMDALCPAPQGRTGVATTAGPLVRDMDKCVRCLRCVTMCRNRGVSALRADSSGREEQIIEFTQSACIRCGQCVRVCPVGALSERDESASALDMLSAPDLFTVAVFSASISGALKGVFSSLSCTEPEGRLAAALRHLGADAVISADFAPAILAANVSTDLAERLATGNVLPLFSASCPAWVNYAEQKLPALNPQLCSARMPQMLSVVLNKGKMAAYYGVPEEKLRILLLSPCTAMKEAPGFDAVLSARALFRLMNIGGICLDTVTPEAFDPFPVSEEPLPPAGEYGEISGAVLLKLGAQIRNQVQTSLPEGGRIVETEALLGSNVIRTALCFSCADAAILASQATDSPYAFIEVLACRGGCPNGGGAAEISEDTPCRTK